jgi:hypothetical protein
MAGPAVMEGHRRQDQPQPAAAERAGAMGEMGGDDRGRRGQIGRDGRGTTGGRPPNRRHKSSRWPARPRAARIRPPWPALRRTRRRPDGRAPAAAPRRQSTPRRHRRVRGHRGGPAARPLPCGGSVSAMRQPAIARASLAGPGVVTARPPEKCRVSPYPRTPPHPPPLVFQGFAPFIPRATRRAGAPPLATAA